VQKCLNVLIVEDEALLGLLLEEMMESLGHQVCAVATSEAEAVDFADKFQPDLMIVDAGLEYGNGVSAVASILQRIYIPHVFMTGDPDRVKKSRPDSVILHKPFFPSDLLAAIDQALLCDGTVQYERVAR
jgi:two-component system, response regulator PdtaR